jgi:hypothetical protein
LVKKHPRPYYLIRIISTLISLTLGDPSFLNTDGLSQNTQHCIRERIDLN